MCKRRLQLGLFGSQARPEVSYERGFEFKEGIFASARKHTDRSWVFAKHFTGPDNVPAFDGNDDGQEITCARALDSLPDLKHWVRNVAQHPDAFWLPLAGGKFYPDFIAELNDGRLMIIEYKGDHLVSSDDTREKRTVGLAWDKAMNSNGLFLLAVRDDNGRQPREQMMDKIATR